MRTQIGALVLVLLAAMGVGLLGRPDTHELAAPRGCRPLRLQPLKLWEMSVRSLDVDGVHVGQAVRDIPGLDAFPSPSYAFHSGTRIEHPRTKAVLYVDGVGVVDSVKGERLTINGEVLVDPTQQELGEPTDIVIEGKIVKASNFWSPAFRFNGQPVRRGGFYAMDGGSLLVTLEADGTYNSVTVSEGAMFRQTNRESNEARHASEVMCK